jgi:hypothetical protein
VTTEAAALERIGDGAVIAESIASLFTDCQDNQAEADGRARAKILSTMGRVESLRHARSEHEFESAFEFLATPRFFREFATLVSDPDVQAFLRRIEACELAGHAAPIRDARAAELANDLSERHQIAWRLVTESSPSAEISQKEHSALAGWLVASSALALAAVSRESWAEWMIGISWTLGRRALLGLAEAAGVAWEVAADGFVTERDRRLSAQPFDADASAETARLLGIQ